MFFYPEEQQLGFFFKKREKLLGIRPYSIFNDLKTALSSLWLFTLACLEINLRHQEAPVWLLVSN